MTTVASSVDFPPIFSPPLLPAENYKVTSGWWEPRVYRHGYHEGVDIPAAVGTPVHATHDGIVTRAFTSQYGGKTVVLAYSNDPLASQAETYPWQTRYMHLSAFAVGVGDPVKAGDGIGLVGTTGHASGPHLHYETLIHHAMISSWVGAFGIPVNGFGRAHGNYIPVPTEPVLPVTYSPKVIAHAKQRNVPVWSPRLIQALAHDNAQKPVTWGHMIAALGMIALASVGVVWAALPGKRKR